MPADSVLLLRLYEKTSAKGNVYFAGRLGQASVVMMRDQRAEGDPVWEVFVSEPRQASTATASAQSTGGWSPPLARPAVRRKSAGRRSPGIPAGVLDDDVSDIGF